MGGVTKSRGSKRLLADRRLLIVAFSGGASLRSMYGGWSSGDGDAVIGAAKARGEDIDDGVDDLVGILLIICHIGGTNCAAGAEPTG